MYLCSKPDPEFLNLPLAHPSSNTIALLCLDWSQPQRFLHSLLTWLSALDRLCHSWTDHVDNSRERPDYAWQNAKDRLSRLWQSYQEPTLKPDGSVQAPLPNATTSNPEASASDLPQGILEDNLGLQLVVVCTKVTIPAECQIYHRLMYIPV